MKRAVLFSIFGLLGLGLPAAAGENNSLLWTPPDRLPSTLQDEYDFGEMGPPDLEVVADADYQGELDQAALASAASALDDGFSFASFEQDDEGDDSPLR